MDPLRSDLVCLLGGYRPVEERERGFAWRMRELLASPADPFSRNHFRPGHFTASGFVLERRGERLLMVHHDKLDRWLQPGGHVEPSDPSLRRAALREVVEETGVEPPCESGELFDLDIHPIPARGDEPAHLHFDVRYLFVCPATAPRGGGGVRAAEWIDLERVMTLNREAAMLRVAQKIQAGFC